MQDWLWGTLVTNSDGTKVLFTTDCSRGYCHCQPWYTDNEAECRFTVSQDLAQRDQQCTCNRQGIRYIRMEKLVMFFSYATDCMA